MAEPLRRRFRSLAAMPKSPPHGAVQRHSNSDLRLDCLLERRRDFPSLSRWPWDHLPTPRSPAPKRTLSGSGGDIAGFSPINTSVDFPGSALTQIKRRSGYPEPRSKRALREGAIAFQQVDPGQSTKSKIYKDALTAR